MPHIFQIISKTFVLLLIFLTDIQVNAASLNEEQPVIVKFELLQKEIESGKTAMLTWEVTGAVHVQISHRPASSNLWRIFNKNWPLTSKYGSVGTKITKPHVFRLRAKNSNGQTVQEIIFVTPKPKVEKPKCIISGVINNMGKERIEIGLYKLDTISFNSASGIPFRSVKANADGAYKFDDITHEDRTKYIIKLLGGWERKGSIGGGVEGVVLCKNKNQFTVDVDLNKYTKQSK